MGAQNTRRKVEEKDDIWKKNREREISDDVGMFRRRRKETMY